MPKKNTYMNERIRAGCRSPASGGVLAVVVDNVGSTVIGSILAEFVVAECIMRIHVGVAAGKGERLLTPKVMKLCVLFTNMLQQ